jgi:uncharacterized protein with GYD domain
VPKYLIQGSYTPETWAKLTRNPEDRAQSIVPIMESVGAHLDAFYFAFGDDDIVVIADAPDNVTAAAIAVAVTSSGAFKAFKTTVLMSSLEGMEVMKKAAGVSYRPPGQR